jgi:hypothetical protein
MRRELGSPENAHFRQEISDAFLHADSRMFARAGGVQDGMAEGE